MNLELINNKIQEMLPEKRYKHSLNVANCAVKLSEIYGCDKEKAYIAGIAHDCAKYLNKDEVKYYVDKYHSGAGRCQDGRGQQLCHGGYSRPDRRRQRRRRPGP